MDVQIASARTPGSALAVVVFEQHGLSEAARRVDGETGGAVSRALRSGRFTGAKGQTLLLTAPSGVDGPLVLLVGGAAEDGFDGAAAETAAAHAYAALKTSGATDLDLEFPGGSEQAAHAALGVRLAAYRFDKYRTTEKAEKKPSIQTVRVIAADRAGAEAAHADLRALGEAIAFARDLVSEPANVLHPEEFARRVKALEPRGLQVEILGEKEMAALGMGSLLGVGQGSARESQLAVIRWNGAASAAEQPVAFIGKGVCFDTGGISIKGADGMEDMKWDMGGAAAVTGLMHVLAGRKAKVNAVGVLGLVENMPDGNAQRPGDVVKSMSGQTIEVINTDAEGRLVLADALWYCQQRFRPKLMVDLATLTGAIIISLGHDYAGLFCNDEGLAEGLLAASKATGDPLWRLPLPAEYDKHIDSAIADMKNVGNGRAGGSITAALFLQRFTNGVPWAHLDIASTAWKKPSSVPTIPEGATGFGVRLLDRFVRDGHEG